MEYKMVNGCHWMISINLTHALFFFNMKQNLSPIRKGQKNLPTMLKAKVNFCWGRTSKSNSTPTFHFIDTEQKWSASGEKARKDIHTQYSAPVESRSRLTLTEGQTPACVLGSYSQEGYRFKCTSLNWSEAGMGLEIPYHSFWCEPFSEINDFIYC
jgi:hypothetical protein